MPDPARQRAVLATSESGLLCLPQGPWHAIWTALRDDQAALHAMRCSCRALRDFSTPLINGALVYFTNTHEADANEDGNVLQLNVSTAVSQLTGFPATAKLSRLQLFCLTNAAKVSNVIPNLFFCTAPRLAAITNLKFDYPHVAFTYGDMAAIASTCPCLRTLWLEGAEVQGAIFSPLARLTCFSKLRLRDVTAPAMQLSIASLAQLTSLTDLFLDDQGVPGNRSNPEDELPATSFASIKVLPALRAMPALRKLDLTLMPNEGEAQAVALCVGKLQHLTCLDIHGGAALDFSALAPRHHACRTWPVACARVLTSLTIPAQVLDTTAIRTLASMPCLAELFVRALDPDTDLSEEFPDCAWRQVMLTTIGSPKQLAWSPLARVACLSMHGTTWEWHLDARDGLEATRALVDKAARLLAQKGRFSAILDSQPMHEGITLHWDRTPEHPVAGQTCWSVVAALEPHIRNLDRLGLPFKLHLGPTWRLSREDAIAGAAQSACVRQLSLHAHCLGLRDFCEALGQLLWLERFELHIISYTRAGGIIPGVEAGKLLPPGYVADLLLELGVRRACAGHSLVLVDCDAMSDRQRSMLNKVAQVQRSVLTGPCSSCSVVYESGCISVSGPYDLP